MDAVTRTSDIAGGNVNLDVALVTAAQRGDRNALETVIARCYPPVYRFLAQKTRDSDAAADLTQETLWRASRNIGQLEQADAFGPWLYRIARNTLYSHSRLDSPHGLSLEWLVAQPRGERHLIDARDAIARWVDDDVMLGALGCLSPQAREALLLRHVHGYSGPEIAEMFDISVMAAYQRVHRAEIDYRRHHQVLDAD